MLNVIFIVGVIALRHLPTLLNVDVDNMFGGLYIFQNESDDHECGFMTSSLVLLIMKYS